MVANGQVQPTRSDPDLRVGNEFLGGPAGTHQRQPRFWTPLRIIMVVGTIVYWVGLLRTWPCMANNWLSPDRYEALCYSDIPLLYQLRGIAEGYLPIVDWPQDGQPLEYPAFTAVWVWLTARIAAVFGGGSVTFYLVNAAFSYGLFLVALAATSLTVRGRTWDGLLLAASPAVLLASFINWDWLAIAFTALALLAWSRRYPAWAGVALGLGVASKFYPLLLLGPLFVLCLRDKRLAAFGTMLATAVGTWLIINVPFMIVNFEGWSYFFRFSAERVHDFGSIWLMLDKVGLGLGTETSDVFAFVSLVVLCLGIAVLIWLAPTRPRVAQVSFLVVAAFLLTNKVYSPQFVLWLIPLAVLARPRWRDLIWWQAAEAVYFVAVWWYLVGTDEGEYGLPDEWYAAAIAVHVVATAVLAGLVVRDILSPRHDPIRSDDDPRHRDDPGGGVLDTAQQR